MTENKSQEEVIDSQSNEVEGGTEGDVVTIPKADWEKTNQTLGSLKRELKDLKKPKETQETTQQTKPEGNQLLEKAFLRAAQITAPDEVELALLTAKKWGVSVDSLVDDEDFQAKLTKLRNQKSNEIATSKVKGSGAKGDIKNTPEFYISRGTPPSRDEVPDRKTRVAIAKAMIGHSKKSKTFYNE